MYFTQWVEVHRPADIAAFLAGTDYVLFENLGPLRSALTQPVRERIRYLSELLRAPVFDCDAVEQRLEGVVRHFQEFSTMFFSVDLTRPSYIAVGTKELRDPEPSVVRAAIFFVKLPATREATAAHSQFSPIEFSVLEAFNEAYSWMSRAEQPSMALGKLLLSLLTSILGNKLTPK